VRHYYAAVQRHDYRAAYALWHGHRGFAAFRRGYTATLQVRVTPIPPFDAEGAAGSVYATIKVKVDALDGGGVWQHFVGSYTLRRVNDIEGASAAQRRWHIESAHLERMLPG